MAKGSNPFRPAKTLDTARSYSMAAMNVYFVGTAGCGKSTLTYAFQQWMQRQGYDAITVNLDPGVEALMYNPDVDVRDWVDLADVMKEYGLGPNGAQIAAADMMALNIKEISEVIAGFDTDYVLIDTPGQLELFTFRQSSKVIVEELGVEDSALAFLFDPSVARTPNGYVSSLMLAATVHFRLPVPMLLLMAKADVLKDAEKELIESWSRDSYSLLSSLMDESGDTQTSVSVEFLQALESIGAGRAVVQVSADTGEGLEDIYSSVQMSLRGGEDLE
ncbi:MAG: GTPase [Candidatus Thermoplasmatota archaeon]|nr:GTPase [Candidatus Thermoplasmatota archaeon]